MFQQVTVAQTGPQLEVDREERYIDQKGKATGKEKVFFALLDQAKGIGRLVPWLVEPVGPMPRSVQHFGP